MFRRPAAPSADAPNPIDGPDADAANDAASDGAPGQPVASSAPDLAALPIAGITRRRMAAVVAGILAAWIVIVFARQVSEASAATGRAVGIAADNVALQRQVAGLDRELDLIARQRFVQQQARAYRLGGPKEIAFTLSPDAPALDEDAPGSAAVRLGAVTDEVEPLERWLTVLFGPSD
jgi:hypothetical protein